MLLIWNWFLSCSKSYSRSSLQTVFFWKCWWLSPPSSYISLMKENPWQILAELYAILTSAILDWRKNIFVNCDVSISPNLFLLWFFYYLAIPQIPKDDEGEPTYEEFICKACSHVCFFLKLYPEKIWAAGKQPDATVQISKDKGVLEDMPSTCGSEKPTCNTSCSSPKVDDAQATVDSKSISDGKSLSQGENCNGSMASNQCTKSIDLHVNCLLGVNIITVNPVLPGKPMFLSKNWRDALCKCNNCLEFYKQKQIAFLLDKEDSIAEYEQMAKQKREEKLQQQEGAELSFFNKLGHVEKVEILKGIEEMKDGLRAFLVCSQT